MVAPVGHGIKLQAVRELHVIGLAKLLELLASLLLSPGAVVLSGLEGVGRGCEVLKLKGLVGRTVTEWGGKGVHGGRVVVEAKAASGLMGQRMQVGERRSGRPCDVGCGIWNTAWMRLLGGIWKWVRCRHREL